MKRRLTFSFLLLGILSSCGDRSTSLLGQMEINPLVNPNTGILIEDMNLSVKMIDSETIVGTGSSRFFLSDDDFQSFLVSDAHDGRVSDAVYLSGSTAICFERTENQFTDPRLLQRLTDGGSWEKLVIPNGSAIEEVVRIQFLDANQGYMAAIDHSAYLEPTKTQVYRINFDLRSVVMVGEITEFVPFELKFLDENLGFMLLGSIQYTNNSHNTFISRTTDGGVTWTTPTAVDLNNRLYNLEVADASNLVAYDLLSGYYSSNGGTSWTKLPEVGYIEGVSFVSGTNGFLVNESGEVYESVNGGATWSMKGLIELPDFGNDFTGIHFFNEDNGIAYGQRELYRTVDGGKTWKVLIYPFAYVTGE